MVISKLSDINDDFLSEIGYGFFAYHIQTDDVTEIEKIKQFEINYKTNLLITNKKESILFEYLDKMNTIYNDVLLLPNTKIEIEFVDYGKR